MAAGLDRTPATVLVTGPLTGVGKTAIAVGLAGELARDLAHHVLLIDADVRRPGVASMLQVDPEYDLADVLELRADSAEAILHSEADNLSALVLRADGPGGSSRISAESLAGLATREIFANFQDAFEYVVIDAGSTEDSAAPRVLASRATGAVMVLPKGVLRHTVRAAKQALESAGGRVLGAVLAGG
jgi:Mrp family chromosome partitioning ATPase